MNELAVAFQKRNKKSRGIVVGRPLSGFRLTRALAVLATLSTWVSVASAVDLNAEHAFDIPAQQLSSALIEFGRQTSIQIMTASEDLLGLQANRVQGTMTVRSALTQLLAGTNLQYEEAGENSVAIAKAVLAKGNGKISYNFPLSSVDSSSTGQTENDRLEEIVVTGSHIRGIAPVGTKVLTIEREAIEKSGYITVQDFMETLPQNFAANEIEVVGSVGNFSVSQGVNLRGLGTGATLVLVNGRRQQWSAEGGLVDISNIPISAIERIEVLPDGASAIYGSEAIGGVINIVLRQNHASAQSSARFATADGDSDEQQFSQTFSRGWSTGNVFLGYQYYKRTPLPLAARDYAATGDKRPFGGTDWSSIRSNPGNILAPGSSSVVAFAIPAGQDGTSLTPSDLIVDTINPGFSAGKSYLLSTQKSHSMFFSAKHQIGNSYELFTDGRLTIRDNESKGTTQTAVLLVPSTNAFYFDPFGDGRPIRVAYDFGEDLGPSTTVSESNSWTITSGVKFNLPHTWTLTSSVTYGVEDSHGMSRGLINSAELNAALADSDAVTAFNPFADGSNTNPATLERIQLAPRSRSFESEMRMFSGIAEGPLLNLPSGAVKGAIGGEYRTEIIDSTFVDIGSQNPNLKRHIFAAFAELALPILRGLNRRDDPLVEASLAGRYEDYDDYGSTFNPKFGLRIAPIESLSFFANWGTSFRAPPVVQVDEIVSAIVFGCGSFERQRNAIISMS